LLSFLLLVRKNSNQSGAGNAAYRYHGDLRKMPSIRIIDRARCCQQERIFMLLPSPRAWADWLSDLKRHQRVAVVMISRPNCPFCEAIRREQLFPLASESKEKLQSNRTISNLHVVEFDLTSNMVFELVSNPGPSLIQAPKTQKALAQGLGIRLAPTLVFLGWKKKIASGTDEFGELAERLVGYGAKDFFSAYLKERIQVAARQVQ
jgi:thiol-disulfide isomerase/thioredoxin